MLAELAEAENIEILKCMANLGSYRIYLKEHYTFTKIGKF